MEAASIYHGCPDRQRFVAPAPERLLFALGLASSFVLLGAGAYATHLGGGGTAVTGMAAATMGVVVFWTVLAARLPQEVIVRGSLVMITRDRHTEIFDLDDPAVEVRVQDDSIAFSHYLMPWVVVRARDVDWEVFRSGVCERLAGNPHRRVARHRAAS